MFPFLVYRPLVYLYKHRRAEQNHKALERTKERKSQLLYIFIYVCIDELTINHAAAFCERWVHRSLIVGILYTINVYILKGPYIIIIIIANRYKAKIGL